MLGCGRERVGQAEACFETRSKNRARYASQVLGAACREQLVRAHRWRRRIESGRAKSIADLAERKGVTDAHVCGFLLLTCLAPAIEVILDAGSRRGRALRRCWGRAAGPEGAAGEIETFAHRDP